MNLRRQIAGVASGLILLGSACSAEATLDSVDAEAVVSPVSIEQSDSTSSSEMPWLTQEQVLEMSIGSKTLESTCLYDRLSPAPLGLKGTVSIETRCEPSDPSGPVRVFERLKGDEGVNFMGVLFQSAEIKDACFLETTTWYQDGAGRSVLIDGEDPHATNRWYEGLTDDLFLVRTTADGVSEYQSVDETLRVTGLGTWTGFATENLTEC